MSNHIGIFCTKKLIFGTILSIFFNFLDAAGRERGRKGLLVLTTAAGTFVVLLVFLFGTSIDVVFDEILKKCTKLKRFSRF